MSVSVRHSLGRTPTALSRAEIDRLFEARRGAIIGTQFDAAWVRMMEGAGWWAPGYTTADELWQRARDTGGWWDPFYDHGDWSRVLRTSSGRFDFRPDVVGKIAESAATTTNGGVSLILFEPLPGCRRQRRRASVPSGAPRPGSRRALGNVGRDSP